MLWVLLLIIIIIILIIWLLQIIDVVSHQFHPLTFSSETPLLIFQTFFSSYSSIIYDIMFLSIISSSSSHSPPWKAVRLFIQNSARTKQAVKVAVRGGRLALAACSTSPFQTSPSLHYWAEIISLILALLSIFLAPRSNFSIFHRRQYGMEQASGSTGAAFRLDVDKIFP